MYELARQDLNMRICMHSGNSIKWFRERYFAMSLSLAHKRGINEGRKLLINELSVSTFLDFVEFLTSEVDVSRLQ